MARQSEASAFKKYMFGDTRRENFIHLMMHYHLSISPNSSQGSYMSYTGTQGNQQDAER